MKIRIEIEDSLEEEETVIRCRDISSEVLAVQKALASVLGRSQTFVLYREDREYYIPLEEILFFETSGDGICAHTADQIFQTKYKLYELEEMLPAYFMRVSKSTVLNVEQIYSITKNFTAAGVVNFEGTPKEAYVSRNYYKALKIKLEERYCHEK